MRPRLRVLPLFPRQLPRVDRKILFVNPAHCGVHQIGGRDERVPSATNNRSHAFLRPGFEHHVEGPLRGASNMAEAAALFQHLGQLRLSRLGAETLADLLRE
jgi:hypothetical protein